MQPEGGSCFDCAWWRPRSRVPTSARNAARLLSRCCRRVQSLFHSVLLNVNNPHFLIMQGRITKVLNMKPPEILGLLEEAAGTKMYEDKKKKALHTLQKKQLKVDEINKVRVGTRRPACTASAATDITTVAIHAGANRRHLARVG